MSALSRMAFAGHKKVEITRNDLVIISANPIPGNEKLVAKVIDELFKHGAEVIYEALDEVHVSGHACQEELKIMLAVTQPKFFIPMHGEYRHLETHARLAEKVGIPKENIFIMNIGQVLELDGRTAKIATTVPSGRILVDGLGVGDVGNIVLRDRKHLAQDGLIVVIITISSETKAPVSDPDIISRGFVYVRESENLMDSIRDIVKVSVNNCAQNGVTDWATLKTEIKNDLSSFLYNNTKRNPMILPVIMEV